MKWAEGHHVEFCLNLENLIRDVFIVFHNLIPDFNWIEFRKYQESVVLNPVNPDLEI